MPRPTDAPPTPSRRTKRRGGSQQRSRSKPIAPTSDVIVAASHTPREAGQGTDLGLPEHVDVPVAAPVLLCRGPTRPLACPGTASAAAPRHVVRATLLPSSRADAGCGGQGTAVPVLLLCCPLVGASALRGLPPSLQFGPYLCGSAARPTRVPGTKPNGSVCVASRVCMRNIGWYGSYCCPIIKVQSF